MEQYDVVLYVILLLQLCTVYFGFRVSTASLSTKVYLDLAESQPTCLSFSFCLTFRYRVWWYFEDLVEDFDFRWPVLRRRDAVLPAVLI